MQPAINIVKVKRCDVIVLVITLQRYRNVHIIFTGGLLVVFPKPRRMAGAMPDLLVTLPTTEHHCHIILHGARV